jgi:hypothetical protein
MWTTLWAGLALLCGVAGVAGWTADWNALLIVLAFAFASVAGFSLAVAIGHHRAQRDPHETHPPFQGNAPRR